MKKKIEKLISNWNIEIANCDAIIESGHVTTKTENFTRGEKYAISECLSDLKKLNEAIVSEDVVCRACKKPKIINSNGLCDCCYIADRDEKTTKHN